MDVKRFLEKVCERPKGFTEVRRDGKDQEAVVNVIRNEIKNCKDRGMPDHVLCKHIQVFASSAWVGINIVIESKGQSSFFMQKKAYTMQFLSLIL